MNWIELNWTDIGGFSQFGSTWIVVKLRKLDVWLHNGFKKHWLYEAGNVLLLLDLSDLFIWYPQSLNDFRNSLSLQEINITNINCPQPSERSSVVHFCLLLCPSSFQWKIRPKNLEGVLGSIGETSCLSVEGNNNMLSLRMLFSFHSSVSISSIKKLIFWYW